MKLTLRQIGEIASQCQKFTSLTSMLIVVKNDPDPLVRDKLIAELENLYQGIKGVA